LKTDRSYNNILRNEKSRVTENNMVLELRYIMFKNAILNNTALSKGPIGVGIVGESPWRREGGM